MIGYSPEWLNCGFRTQRYECDGMSVLFRKKKKLAEEEKKSKMEKVVACIERLKSIKEVSDPRCQLKPTARSYFECWGNQDGCPGLCFGSRGKGPGLIS